MKNRLKQGLAGLALLLLASLTTNAQSNDKTGGEKPKWIYSAGVEGGVTVGSFNDFYGGSVGGSLEADLAILKRTLYVTLNAGYTDVFGKDNAQDLSFIPVKAGLRYYPFSHIDKLYIQGQAGVNILANKSDVGADKSAVFLYTPQIGYLFPLGKNHNYLDVAVKWDGSSKLVDGGDSFNSIGLHVAYAFGSKK